MSGAPFLTSHHRTSHLVHTASQPASSLGSRDGATKFIIFFCWFIYLHIYLFLGISFIRYCNIMRRRCRFSLSLLLNEKNEKKVSPGCRGDFQIWDIPGGTQRALSRIQSQLCKTQKLKVHKHEIILNFSYRNRNLICPWSILEKKFDSFPSIFDRISMFKHFLGDWAYEKPTFLCKQSKKIFPQNFHFGPIRWVPIRFFKILIIYSQNLQFN